MSFQVAADLFGVQVFVLASLKLDTGWSRFLPYDQDAKFNPGRKNTFAHIDDGTTVHIRHTTNHFDLLRPRADQDVDWRAIRRVIERLDKSAAKSRTLADAHRRLEKQEKEIRNVSRAGRPQD